MILFQKIHIICLIGMLTALCTFVTQNVHGEEGISYTDEQGISYTERIRREPTAEKMIFDTILVRPIMLAGTIIGSAMWVLSLPFSAAAGNSDEAKTMLVAEPAYHTFNRPLGDFNY